MKPRYRITKDGLVLRYLRSRSYEYGKAVVQRRVWEIIGYYHTNNTTSRLRAMQIDLRRSPGDGDIMNPIITCYLLFQLATGQPVPKSGDSVPAWGSMIVNEDEWFFMMYRNGMGYGVGRQGVGSLDALPDILKRLGLTEVKRPCGSAG